MRFEGMRSAMGLVLAVGAGCTSTVLEDGSSGNPAAVLMPGSGGASSSASTGAGGSGQGGGGASAQSSAASSGGGGAGGSGLGGAASSVASSTTNSSTSSTGSTTSAVASSSSTSSTGGAISSGAGGGATASSSSSGGTGGGPLCAPAPIIGLDYIDTGIMSARLDPTTGIVTDIAPLAVEDDIADGFAAYDPLTKHLYELGESVYTIDTGTGALLHAAKLSTNNTYNPVVNSAGEIFVLDLDAHATATVDPVTGAVTDLVPYTSVGGIAQAFRGYDPITDHVYQLGQSVYTFDGTTGALLFSAVEGRTGGLYNPGVNAAGQILGIDLSEPGGAQVARLDPVTGDVTDLAVVPPNAGFAQGMYAFDPCANLMYQVGPEFVLTADGATGAVISVKTTNRENFLNFVAAW